MTGNGTITETRRDEASLDHTRDMQLSTALARCAAGDHAALQMIYNSEAARMIGVARRILSRQDLAEEAVHDAFVNIWCTAASFDQHRGSARGWLYAAVRSRALGIHRNEHRYEAPDDSALDIDCEATVTRMSEASALRRCLERIDPPRREVVVLAYVHGMSYDELAGRLKVPLGTVKTRIRRSLSSLQECMG